jgi:hypothetical protein
MRRGAVELLPTSPYDRAWAREKHKSGIVMSTWRGSPFTADAEYRVIRAGRTWSWNGSGGDLSIDQILRYVDASYSHYDNCSAYIFRDAKGQEFWWALHDDEPLEKWQEVFVIVANDA